jgi:hypothetical protein
MDARISKGNHEAMTKEAPASKCRPSRDERHGGEGFRENDSAGFATVFLDCTSG